MYKCLTIKLNSVLVTQKYPLTQGLKQPLHVVGTFALGGLSNH